MKKFLILALALVLALSMFACGNKEPEPVAEPTAEPTEEPKQEAALIGSWTLSTMESEGMSFHAADLGASMTFEFGEDGNVVITAYGETSTDPYTFTDNAIVISEPTGDVNGVYDPETDTIRFEQEGVTLTLVRAGSEPEAEATEATAAPEVPTDVNAEDLAGEWNLTKAKAMGMELPTSSLGVDMVFVFNADGSASMTSGEEKYDGLDWTFSDGIVKLSAYGTDLYDFTFDGSTLTLHEDDNDVDLIFEKQN